MAYEAYEVYVGNIGLVYAGDDPAFAIHIFREYIEQSKRGYGQAAHAAVTLMKDGKIDDEYLPLDEARGL